MTKIFNKLILLLFALGMAVTVSASPEGEYKKLSKSWKLNADGSQEFHYNMELTIYTHTAMRSLYGETFIVYNPDFQSVKINASYTRQKDGNIVKTPDNAFVENLPRSAADAPAYNKLKELVIVHTGLELGATIYLDYTLTTKPGYLPALDIFETIQQTSPVKNYSISVTAPEAQPLSYCIANPAAKANVKVADGMRTVSWNLKNVQTASHAPMSGELAAGDVQYLAVSSYKSNKDAVNALFGKFDKVGNIPVATLAETLTEGKTTETEKLQAIHSFIRTNFAFSKLSLAETGYSIRPAEDVITSAYGTNEELLNLMYGLLKAVKVDAEVCALYPVKDFKGVIGLKPAAFFLKAQADGQTYLLSPNSGRMHQAGWLADHALILNAGTGDEVKLPSISPKLDYEVAMDITAGKAVSKVKAVFPAAMVAYSDTKAAAFTAGDKKATVSQKQDQMEVKYQTSEAVTALSDYILVNLPQSPAGVSHQLYASYNTSRDCSLFLTSAPQESYSYTVTVPEGMELSTPVGTTNITNAAGSYTFSVKQNGNSVEVKRSLSINSAIISKSVYPAFHTLMAAWANDNGTHLMFKKK